MMNKKPTIDEVLIELNFTEKERDAFKKCIRLVKAEQEQEMQNVEDEIKKIIREVTKNEVQEDNI